MSLIERLRDEIKAQEGDYDMVMDLSVIAEAATQLEAMQAEIDRLREALLAIEEGAVLTAIGSQSIEPDYQGSKAKGDA